MHASISVVGPTTMPRACVVVGHAIEQISYSRYRFRAEVDWIRLRIVTTVATNFQTVRRRLGAGYAEATSAGSGGAGTEFSVIFQSPQCWADIEARLKLLTVDHPLAEPVVVTGVEIALDAYSRSLNHDDLVEMTVGFYNGAAKVVSDNRRASKVKGESFGLDSLPQVRRLVAKGYNIYIGNRHDPERQHIYLKETDSTTPLPIHQHRARTEFTLEGDMVTETDFNKWATHQFTEYAHYFKFRRLKADLPLMVAGPLRLQAQIGERRPHKTARGHLRYSSRSTTADRSLNAAAYDALRLLGDRWSRPT